MMKLNIQSADVYVVGPQVERFRFSSDMGEVYETLTILKLTSSDGGAGIGGVTLFSENSFDQSLGESLRTLLPAIIGKTIDDPADLTRYLLGRYNSMTPMPQGLIDIALWDCLAKRRQEPLYLTLGGSRVSMPAYASLPLFDNPTDYITFIHKMIGQHRFSTFKLHGWCELSGDLALIQALREEFAGQAFEFIFDFEERYTLSDAITLAQEIEGLNCAWIEAPLPDTDLQAYRQLREATTIPIVPAGNTLDTLGLVQFGVAAQAWDAIRVDANYAGGISMVNEIIDYGEAHNLPTELQAWGYTLSQATNLHLSLASALTRYFEVPVPYLPHEACALNTLRAEGGMITAPAGHGLGMKIDWDMVDRDLLRHYRVA